MFSERWTKPCPAWGAEIWNRFWFIVTLGCSITRWGHCRICSHRGHTVAFLLSYPEHSKIKHEAFLTYSDCSSEFTSDCFLSRWLSHFSSSRRSLKARFTEASSPGSSYKWFFPNPGGKWGGRRRRSSLCKFHYASCSFFNVICLYCLVVISRSGINFVYTGWMRKRWKIYAPLQDPKEMKPLIVSRLISLSQCTLKM